MIYTHQNLDIDAASSVWLFKLYHQRDDEVIFVPADYVPNTAVEYAPDIYIDIPAGGLGWKGEKSAFSEILERTNDEFQEAFKDLKVLIDIKDSTGETIRIPGMSSGTIVDTFIHIKDYYGKDDNALLLAWKPVIIGMLSSYRRYQKALRAADRAKMIENIPIIKNAPSQTASILHSRGAEFVVYEDGFNVGVIRSNSSKKNLGELLRDRLPTWFHHKSGFLSCWGCNKAPKYSPADISAEELAEIVSTF